MQIDLEKIKDDLITVFYNQFTVTHWEKGEPMFRELARYLTEQVLIAIQLPSLISEYKNLEKNSKPQCESTGHCWEQNPLGKPALDFDVLGFTCKHCKKCRTKIVKEILTWED